MRSIVHIRKHSQGEYKHLDQKGKPEKGEKPGQRPSTPPTVGTARSTARRDRDTRYLELIEQPDDTKRSRLSVALRTTSQTGPSERSNTERGRIAPPESGRRHGDKAPSRRKQLRNGTPEDRKRVVDVLLKDPKPLRGWKTADRAIVLAELLKRRSSPEAIGHLFPLRDASLLRHALARLLTDASADCFPGIPTLVGMLGCDLYDIEGKDQSVVLDAMTAFLQVAGPEQKEQLAQAGNELAAEDRNIWRRLIEEAEQAVRIEPRSHATTEPEQPVQPAEIASEHRGPALRKALEDLLRPASALEGTKGLNEDFKKELVAFLDTEDAGAHGSLRDAFVEALAFAFESDDDAKALSKLLVSVASELKTPGQFDNFCKLVCHLNGKTCNDEADLRHKRCAAVCFDAGYGAASNQVLFPNLASVRGSGTHARWAADFFLAGAARFMRKHPWEKEEKKIAGEIVRNWRMETFVSGKSMNRNDQRILERIEKEYKARLH